MEPTASRYFEPTYAEARAAFRAAADAVGARLTSCLHPLPGRAGEPLAIDIAEIGDPAARRAVFVCSATHGVEGFPGSAVQIGLLKSGWSETLPPAVKLVLIHALNPYGFSHLRRFTETNIDLNRNFVADGDPVPKNAGYEALAGVLAPRSISAAAEAAALLRLLLFAARNGFAAAREAVTGGQYTHPDGLFYGGEGPSWSALRLGEILADHGADLERAVFVDIHTGLGRFAAAEMISNSPKGSPSFERAAAIWGDMVRTTKAGESVSADLAGTLKLGVERALPGVEITAASIEFGTLPAVQVLRALRAENWLWRQPSPDPARADRIKAALVAAFNPDDDGWRAAVWRQGRAAVAAAVDRMATA